MKPQFTTINGLQVYLAPIRTSDYYADPHIPAPVLQKVAPFFCPHLQGASSSTPLPEP